MTTEQDQARRLRELVRESSRLRFVESRARVAVVVAGGCPQVGTTTITHCLAAELDRQTKPSCESHEDRSIVLIDAEAGYTDQTSAHWHDADLVLLVTTPDRDAVLETYATLKKARADLSHVPIYLVVNRCESYEVASDVGNRISESSERFLGIPVPMSGWIPEFEKRALSANPSVAELARFLLDCPKAAKAMQASEAAA